MTALNYTVTAYALGLGLILGYGLYTCVRLQWARNRRERRKAP